MSDKAKQSAVLAFVIAALLLLGISAFKVFGPKPSTSSEQERQYNAAVAQKMNSEPAPEKRPTAYGQKMLERRILQTKQ